MELPGECKDLAHVFVIPSRIVIIVPAGIIPPLIFSTALVIIVVLTVAVVAVAAGRFFDHSGKGLNMADMATCIDQQQGHVLCIRCTRGVTEMPLSTSMRLVLEIVRIWPKKNRGRDVWYKVV